MPSFHHGHGHSLETILDIPLQQYLLPKLDIPPKIL